MKNMRNVKSSKKVMKLVAAAVLTAGIAAAVSGCARKAETAASTAAETETAAESGAAGTVAESETAAESGAAENAAETAAQSTAASKNQAGVSGEVVGVITGTVTEAGMSTVAITMPKYPEGITFLKEDAATGFAEGLLPDQEITIFYRGEIKGGDTSGVTVELLRDKRDGDEDAEASMITGTVVGIGMSVITLETEDGKTVSFEQDPKPVNMTDGPMEGEKVTLIYSYQDEASEGAVVPELIR